MKGKIHTNGIELFWVMLEHDHQFIYHKMSPKHLYQYIIEFAGSHNVRQLDTIQQMASIALRMEGKLLRYDDLVAKNV